MLYLIVALVLSYLIGSVSFAVVVGKIFAKIDIRKHGSGNAGMTNVVRVVGVLPGIITFLLDFGKCVLACYIGQTLFEHSDFIAFGDDFTSTVFVWACGIACIIGHCFPVFFRFKGGKGAASGLGLLFYSCPIAAVVAIAVFAIVFIVTRIVSLSSILATVSAVFSVWGYIASGVNDTYTSNWNIYLCAVAVIIIVARHWQNILRLFKGTEKQLKAKK